jgi:hypothetical protein
MAVKGRANYSPDRVSAGAEIAGQISVGEHNIGLIAGRAA